MWVGVCWFCVFYGFFFLCVTCFFFCLCGVGGGGGGGTWRGSPGDTWKTETVACQISTLSESETELMYCYGLNSRHREQEQIFVTDRVLFGLFSLQLYMNKAHLFIHHMIPLQLHMTPNLTPPSHQFPKPFFFSSFIFNTFLKKTYKVKLCEISKIIYFTFFLHYMDHFSILLWSYIR